MANLSVTVVCSAPRCWVTIDSTDMYDTDKTPPNLGPQAFDPGQHHCTWWMLGEPADTISIQITNAGTPVTTVTGAIPPGQNAAADAAIFNV
jgi:hypothetical protein